MSEVVPAKTDDYFGTAFTQSHAASDGRFLSQDPRVRLEAWQARLAEHFARLAKAREESGWPVFALEHGLNTADRELLKRDVWELAVDGPSRDTPLPWVVYAAEIGYEYSGLEYWQTFESKTPNWQSQWRERVRLRFVTFAANYHGAKPDGNWAQQFNIIAWPITHGILPRDLQRQLARLLFDASKTFSADTFASAEALGYHLQRRCFGYSSRFHQFAENTGLLGQIALALLLQNTADARGSGHETLLHSATLTRIIDDLNCKPDASYWLAEARSAARFRVRGIARIPLRGRTTGLASGAGRTFESSEAAETHRKPRLLLREESADHWQVRLQLPNLRYLAVRSARSMDTLTRAQGRVAGATNPILASGRIIRDTAPTVTLGAWPAPQTQLLTFDGAPPELEAALSANFRFDAGERLLFSIGSDAQARQLATRVLRAGASYLLLQASETRNPAAGLRAVQLACAGIYAVRIDVPTIVPDALVAVLEILGLEVSRKLEVWPAGLPVPEWSADGQAMLVAGQPIFLGIRGDYAIERLTITVDNAWQNEVAIEGNALDPSALFVQLAPLQTGSHRIAIAAHAAKDVANAHASVTSRTVPSVALEGELACVVREPRTAHEGEAGALSFAILPSAPSLEDIWEDRIELHVAVPGAASVRGRVVLLGLGKQVLFTRQLTLSSPCTTDVWRRAFALVRKSAQANYDDAQSCVLDFEAGALGRGRATAERDFTPLRWAIRANGHRAVLIDSEGAADLAVFTIPCVAPSFEQRAAAASALEGLVIGDGGALVVARSGRLEAATIVVPQQRMGSLAELAGTRPQVPASLRDSSALAALARTAALWERARLAGSSLAEVRRTAAVDALIARLVGTVAGERWLVAESTLRDQGPKAAANVMRNSVTNRSEERAVVVMLADRAAAAAQGSVVEAASVLLGALKPFLNVEDLEVLAAYALRLVASPAEAHALAEGWAHTAAGQALQERALIDGLLAAPVILRAARFFVIATRVALLDRGMDRGGIPWEH